MAAQQSHVDKPPEVEGEAGKSGSEPLQDIEAGQPAKTAREPAVATGRSSSWYTRAWSHLSSDVDTDKCTVQLAIFCLITGWIDSVSFAAAFIFAGFQTGNTVQLAGALTQLFIGPGHGSHFHMADRLALTSILSFAGGAFLGQIGDRLGPKSRLWVIGATALQAGFLMAACIAISLSGSASFATNRGEVAWTTPAAFVGLGFMSASMGFQGIVGKRLNTHYGTTVVLTTIWCELVADPSLFRIRSYVPSRDHRINAVLFLFLGAFFSRCIIASIGTTAALGIVAGIKFLVALSFWFVPDKGGKKQALGGLDPNKSV